MDSSRKKIASTYLCTSGIASSNRHICLCVWSHKKRLPYSSPTVCLLCWCQHKHQPPGQKSGALWDDSNCLLLSTPPLYFPCWKFWFEECNLETFSLLPVPGWQGSYFRLDILHPHSPWQFLTSVNCESCKLAGLIPGQVQAAFVTISSICQGREAGNEGCIY